MVIEFELQTAQFVLFRQFPFLFVSAHDAHQGVVLIQNSLDLAGLVKKNTYEQTNKHSCAFV